MDKIEAYLRPAALEEVQKVLASLGIAGMSVIEVRGFGRQRGHREVYRGAEYQINFVPKVKVEIAVSECNRDPAVNAIVEAAKTGKVGDGKVFVVPIAEAVRIRYRRKRRERPVKGGARHTPKLNNLNINLTIHGGIKWQNESQSSQFWPVWFFRFLLLPKPRSAWERIW
jgi:nitrogen regulatory protein P-II 1